MILLATFANDLEAQLLASQLKDAGIDHRIVRDDGGGQFPSMHVSDGVRVMVFEDDLELAREIMEARALDDDEFGTPFETDTNLDEFADDI